MFQIRNGEIEMAAAESHKNVEQLEKLFSSARKKSRNIVNRKQVSLGNGTYYRSFVDPVNPVDPVRM